MVDPDDWRLQGQGKYLHGITLTWKPYRAYSTTWGHDHCEFCGTKFIQAGSLSDGDPDPGSDSIAFEGYTTTDEYAKGADYVWICGECFDDFAARFEWNASPAEG